MKYKKHHLLIGTLSLVINIILPTFIFSFYQKLTNACDAPPEAYGIISILIILWLASLFIALRELGGLMHNQLNQTYNDNAL